MDGKKKFAIWFLFLATIMLGSGAVYFGYNLREQPESSLPETGAVKQSYTCETGKFTDKYTGSSLKTNYWTSQTTLPITESIIINDGVLQMVVTNIDSSVNNSTAIRSVKTYTGDIRAKASNVSQLKLDQRSGPVATYSINFISNSNNVIFGLSKQATYSNGELIEEIVGYVNDEKVKSIMLDADTGMIDMIIQRKGNLVSGYIYSESLSEVEIFSKNLGSNEDGRIQNNLTMGTGVQNANIELDQFEIGCIDEITQSATPVNTNIPCMCQAGKVTQDNCSAELISTCNDDGTCSCEENIAQPLATIIVVSGTPIFTSPTITTPTSTPTQAENETVKIEQNIVNDCTEDNDEVTSTHSIKLTNNTSETVSISVDVSLDDKIDRINMDSITHNGTHEVTFNKIKWESLDPLASGDSITLNFEMVINTANIEGNFTNDVSVFVDKDSIGASSKTFEIDCLPDTALISDSVDRFIIAISLIIIGYMMFVGGLHKVTGNIIWNTFGENIIKTISPMYAQQINDNKKEVFEKQMSRSIN